MPTANKPLAYVNAGTGLYDHLRASSSTHEAEIRSNLAKFTLDGNDWEDLLSTDPLEGLNRLHYYQYPALSHYSLSELGKKLFTDGLGNFRDHPVELAASVYDGTYLYLIFIKQATDDDITAVAVLRPNADVFTIRVQEDDQALTTFHRLKQDFNEFADYNGPSTNRPAFDKAFHSQFEIDLVDRYDRIWISFDEDASDDALNKVQFLADGRSNAKDSTHVTDILSEKGTRIYGGRVEASGLALTTGRTFFFNWDERRVTFQQRPSEQAKLEISDSLLRVYDRALTPPFDRILSPDATPVRVEVYDDQVASTWQSYTSLQQFLSQATEELDEHSRTIIYHDDGVPTITELANLGEDQLDDVTFIRVGGEQQTVTWEPNTINENRSVVGLIEDVHGDTLPTLYEQTVEGTFSERTRATLRDISEVTEVAE